MSSLGTLLSSSIRIFEVLLQGVDFVVEDGYDLLARDAFEIVQELVDGRAVFESFEKRGDGEPGVLEDPRSADFVRASFDGVATVPVAHGVAFFLHGYDVLILASTPRGWRWMTSSRWSARPVVATGFTRIEDCWSVPAIGRPRW